MGDALLCVLCHTRPVDERYKPFCSERCRNEDLARWAEGSYRAASDSEPLPADDASNDLEPD